LKKEKKNPPIHPGREKKKTNPPTTQSVKLGKKKGFLSRRYSGKRKKKVKNRI